MRKLNRGKGTPPSHNRSIATSKNRSKQQKVEPVEEVKQPYFNNHLSRQIQIRVNTRNLNDSKGQENNHLSRATRIVDDIRKKNQEVKQKLRDIKKKVNDENNQIPAQTKQPEFKGVNKFHIPSNVIRRNQIWMQEKRRKQMELKAQYTLEDLRECTFSPSLKQRKMSKSYLKEKNSKSQLTPDQQKLIKNKCNLNQILSISPYKSVKKEISYSQYQTAKKNLILKMMTNPIITN